MPIESGNPAILRTIKKGITRQLAAEAVGMCRRAGIRPYASFILGLPGETPDTIKETAAFAAELQNEGLAYGFHILAPFPGTEVRAKSEALGIRVLSNDWSRYDANRAVSETAAVNRRMLDAVVVDWENKYNQYLHHIDQRIRDGSATSDEAGELENLERTVVLYELMMSNSIEENGSLALPATGPQWSQQRYLEILVDRLTGAADIDPDKLRTALQHAAANQNLKLVHRDGKIRWEWEKVVCHRTPHDSKTTATPRNPSAF